MTPPPARYRVTAPVLITVAGVLILAGAFVYRSLGSQGWPLPRMFCLFKTITGFPCPTCGTTRAFLALSRGEIFTALSYQPLIMIVTLGSIVLTAVDLAAWKIGKVQPLAWIAERSSLSTWSVIIVILVNWLYVLLHLSARIHQWLHW